jgi:hypothetical protein
MAGVPDDPAVLRLVCSRTARLPVPAVVALDCARRLAHSLHGRVWVQNETGYDIAAFDDAGEAPCRAVRREEAQPPRPPVRTDEHGESQLYLG